MRATHQVPQEDQTRRGERVKFTTKFRGQDVVLAGSIMHTLWDRRSGQNIVYIRPDYVEEYAPLVRYGKVSVPESQIVEV